MALVSLGELVVHGVGDCSIPLHSEMTPIGLIVSTTWQEKFNWFLTLLAISGPRPRLVGETNNEQAGGYVPALTIGRPESATECRHW